jgi:hypothetical protein
MFSPLIDEEKNQTNQHSQFTFSSPPNHARQVDTRTCARSLKIFFVMKIIFSISDGFFRLMFLRWMMMV